MGYFIFSMDSPTEKGRCDGCSVAYGLTYRPPLLGRNKYPVYCFFTDILPHTGQWFAVFILCCSLWRLFFRR